MIVVLGLVGLVEVLFVAAVLVVVLVVVVAVLVLGPHQGDADVEPSPPPKHKQTHETDNTTTKETAYTSAVRVSVTQRLEDKTGCHA